MNSKFDVIVIGGGATGLFCAIEAGKRGRRVLVLERNAQVGRKIIISGGGRCNFTNIHTSPENFVTKNPHFAKSALARFTPDDFIRLVRQHRIEYYEKKLGQLFCRDSSRQIVDMLLAECSKQRVNIRVGCAIEKIEHEGSFVVNSSDGTFIAESLVIATGGLSFPKVGATDFGYTVARQFGLKIEPMRPALVPLVFAGGTALHGVAGTSVDSLVRTRDASFRENILFTHRGLSGPAILQISNYWSKNQPVTIDLLPDVPMEEIQRRRANSRQILPRFLSQFIPAKLADELSPARFARIPVNEIAQRDFEPVSAALKDWSVSFRETEGYHKAEVTSGGVSTDELSSQTMMAKRVPGLFFIGEVVDVTGWLGGYNFQWAWASGYAAGQAV